MEQQMKIAIDPHILLVGSIVFLFESLWLYCHHSTGFYLLMVSVASLWCLTASIRAFKEFRKGRRTDQTSVASDSSAATLPHESGHVDPPPQ
jgi:heme O synthase-like polyprenyltransferase